jgi:trk system potassium uptake protein TrkH
MPEFIGPLVKYPARVSLLWYVGVILAGAVLLCQPFCGVPGREPVSFLDAMFTATSATCVTGLAVRSTELDFSFAGQLVILLLIQLGGIGIMTITTYFIFKLTGRTGLRDQVLIGQTIGSGPNMGWVLRHVLWMTFLFEAAGTALLFGRFAFEMPPLQAAWHALFHTIAAFCNAGFGLHDDSLIRYQGDVYVNLVICGLIVGGGIGYPVLMDLRLNWGGPWRSRFSNLSVHSKLMLLGTTFLILLGTAGILALEWDAALADAPLPQKLLVSFFQAVTPRTAGFNTVNMADLTDATLFLIIGLMMIGAGPCSTAGGFKVSTLMVLVLQAWSLFRGYRRPRAFRRTIPESIVLKAIATAMLFAVISGIALSVLLALEHGGEPHRRSHGLFLDAAFEVVSAIGTVGLSTGITPALSAGGKVVIIFLMLLGRLGPISVFVALSWSERRDTIEYAAEEPLIG